MGLLRKYIFSFLVLSTNSVSWAYTPDEWMVLPVKDRYAIRSLISTEERTAIWNQLTLQQKLALQETNKAYDSLLAGDLGAFPAGSPYSVNQWITKGPQERANLRASLKNSGIDIWNVLTLEQKNAMTETNQALDRLSQVVTGGSFCDAFSQVNRIDVTWGDGTRYKTSQMTGFSFNQDSAIVVAVKIPENLTTFAISGYTSIFEYQGPPTLRAATLSRFPCDFRNIDSSGVNGPFNGSGGTQASILWNVGNGPDQLNPGQTYYFNFRNYNCNQSRCDAMIETYWPHN